MKTTLNAVIRHSSAATLSPVVHAYIYERYGIDALTFPFSIQDPLKTVLALRDLGVGFIAVTIPHKQKVIEVLDELDLAAKEIGAVNTIVNRDGKLIGYNTDVDGIRFGLGDYSLQGKKVLVIGAGGAARAASYVAMQGGAILTVTNRTVSRGKELADKFGGHFIELKDVKNNRFDLILNMTPLAHEMPIEYSFTADMTVLECNYALLKTKLLEEAQRAGARIVPGMEMFAGQAAKQIELWSGRVIDPHDIKDCMNEHVWALN